MGDVAFGYICSWSETPSLGLGFAGEQGALLTDSGNTFLSAHILMRLSNFTNFLASYYRIEPPKKVNKQVLACKLGPQEREEAHECCVIHFTSVIEFTGGLVSLGGTSHKFNSQ